MSRGVALAEELSRVAPDGLTRTFFSDDGSTAVEVALKIALQAHAQRDEPQRRVFVALEGGYHGDTFGAMAVGDPDPFFMPFAPFLFEVQRVPAESAAIVGALDELGERAAGVILEPRLQGAAGMRIHDAAVVRAVRSACDERGVFLIADEVMTGFGRTGALFSCLACGVTPDLLCLAKGLTGGMYPLSATMATEALYETFLSDVRTRALFHGHTFTGNPTGCAVALESLRVNEERDTPGQLQRVGECILGGLSSLEGDERVAEPPPPRRHGGLRPDWGGLRATSARAVRGSAACRPGAGRAAPPPRQRGLRAPARVHLGGGVRDDLQRDAGHGRRLGELSCAPNRERPVGRRKAPAVGPLSSLEGRAPPEVHSKVIVYPSVKFETGKPRIESRYQHWKFQVSPGCTATLPVGWGMAVRSTVSGMIPKMPALPTWLR